MKARQTFDKSVMNKSVDERFLGKGEYVDAMNIRVTPSLDGEGGTAENELGNLLLTNLTYNNTPLSSSAETIGSKAFEDRGLIFWMVCDNSLGVDLIVSYDVNNNILKKHVQSVSVLNFSKQHRINAINLIGNFLFFTDNYNPPRVIDITKGYPKPLAGTDYITEDDISVAVVPPLSAPTVTTISGSQEKNYMEDKFICFAYRWRYSDGRYSAVSPISQPSFIPGVFSLDYRTYDMTGMLNTQSGAIVSFNTGSSKVTDVEVLFKETHTQVYKVIDRFNKKEEGWGTNETRQLTFDNRKIYTTLPESELLRLYDRVPLLAKGQTLIGNRLGYANYLEQYDIGVNVDFDLELISEQLGDQNLDTPKEDYTYTEYESRLITDAGFSFDLDGLDLVKGAVLFLDVSFGHSQFAGDPGYPVDPADTNDFDATVGIVLSQDYLSVASFFASVDFQRVIGGIYAQTIANCSEGYSLDDLFNCGIDPSLGWTFEGTSQFAATLSGSEIKIYPPVIRVEEDAAPGTYAYEYFYTIDATVNYRTKGNNGSLHSDRDYEVGIVYMDGKGRASTPQTVPTATVYTPKNSSDKLNYIQATINSVAPDWAEYYKFVIKPSKSKYETIYSNIFYKDNKTGTWFCKLLGDNISKASVGDRLIVKRSSQGISYGQPKAKILSLTAKEENFIDSLDPDGVIEPTGTYMEVTGSFAIEDNSAENYISYGLFPTSSFQSDTPPGVIPLIREGIAIDNIGDTVVEGFRTIDTGNIGPSLAYPAYINTGTASARTYVEYEIPAGSVVHIYFEFFRYGSNRFRFLFDKEFLATQNYSNLHAFILGENIDFTIPSNDPAAESDTNTPTVEFTETISAGSTPDTPPTNLQTGLMIQYCENIGAGSGGEDVHFLGFQCGPNEYGGNATRLDVNIEIRRATDVLVFETQPLETDGATFYEASDVFSITDGYHEGTVQDQSSSLPAIVDLNFFDCYSFGNGVESYKVRDALDGHELTIGYKPHIVTEEEYKQVRREDDITYSGVFTFDTNVNKLNEFNAALGNFKSLDRNRGPITLIDYREDNILVLKENGISYVLANGKDLFSDAQGGGAIINVPTVLGQELTRPEIYGCIDPETYVSYGGNIFFADANRNAIINLSGGGGTKEVLSVISNSNMRPWFRNLFRDKKDKVKLAGFDPFNNEYVISSTSINKQSAFAKVAAGESFSVLSSNDAVSLDVDFDGDIGEVTVDYNVSSGSIDVSVDYNGVEVYSGTFSGIGSFTFDKDDVDVNVASITITPTDATYEISFSEPVSQQLTVVNVVLNAVDLSGDVIGIEVDVNGRTYPDKVYLGSEIVSKDDFFTGSNGTNGIPFEGENVTLRIVDDSYSFDSGIDRIGYLVTDTLYTKATMISTLIGDITEITPITATANGAGGTFTFTNPTGKAYLYLVWDLYSGH